MLRFVCLLPLLMACDQVLGLEIRALPPVCGPYAAPTEILFHEELVDPHDFSVDSSGIRGMIHARFTGATTRTGVHAIRFEDPVWRLDPQRDDGGIDDGVLGSLDGAHISENDREGDAKAVGWIQSGVAGGTVVSEYEFATGANRWFGPVSNYIDPVRSDASIAGNVIVVMSPGGVETRFAVTVKQSGVTGIANTIRIFQRGPIGIEWALTAQADPLKSAREKLNPSGAVMTADHGKLVYAATLDKSSVSRLFSTERVADEFEHGPELIIEGLDDDAHLTEPWINADCSVVYFRHNDATWMTTAVDD